MILALLIFIMAFLLNLILPWWSIALPGLVFGYYMKLKGGASFAWGFVAVFVLWGGQSLYIHFANDGILSGKIAALFGLSSPYLVILLTALIGALVSGLAALSGSLLADKANNNNV